MSLSIEQEAKQWLTEKYKMTDFNSYQRIAATTAIYPDNQRIVYPALGMAGEAGEVANKVKKIIRDGPNALPKEWRKELSKEIGDVLWYCAALASDLNIDLQEIVSENIQKLLDRKQRNVIGGSGDNR